MKSIQTNRLKTGCWIKSIPGIHCMSILKINVTYRVDARNIIQAKQEFLQFLSTDFDRTVDKKLGDYGFDSENINR